MAILGSLSCRSQGTNSQAKSNAWLVPTQIPLSPSLTFPEYGNFIYLIAKVNFKDLF